MKMMNYRLFRGLVCGACFLLSLGGARLAAQSDVLARVGSEEVGLDDVRAMLPEMDETQRMALAGDPETLNQLVRTLIVRQIVLEEALRAEWDLNAEAQRRMERARETALVESYLQAISSVPMEFPSERQLRAFYESNLASFTSPGQVRLAQVFLSTTGEASEEEVAAKAGELHSAISSGQLDFAEAARSMSDEEATAGNGGEIGWVQLDTIQPDLVPHLEGLEAGQVTRPVRLEDGFHIVRLIERRDAFTLPFEDVREQLAVRLREDRANANRRAYLSRLLRENPVAINELVLARLLGDES